MSLVPIFSVAYYLAVQLVKALLPLLFGICFLGIQLAFRAAVVWGKGASSNMSNNLANCSNTPFLCSFVEWVAFPDDYWHGVVLISLYLSVFAAFVLYYQFPFWYHFMDFGSTATPMLYFVIPSVQILCIAYASLTIQYAHRHLLATILYVALFVLWDLVIFMAKPKSETFEQGKKFQAQVWAYFWNVDLPCVIAFSGLYYLAGNQPDFAVFVAGVLAFQATAASITAIRTYWQQHVSVLLADISCKIREAFPARPGEGSPP